MIVEFVGCEGAGKSTVVPFVRQLLGATLHLGHGFGRPRANMAIDRAIAVIRNPQLAIAAARCPGDLRQRAKSAFGMTRRDRLARRLKGRHGLHLLDGGPIHELCSVSARGSYDGAALAHRIYRPDCVVWLVVSEDAVRERARTRDPFDPVGVPLRQTIPPGWLRRYEDAAEEVMAVVGCELIHVNADREVPLVAQEVVDALRPKLDCADWSRAVV